MACRPLLVSSIPPLHAFFLILPSFIRPLQILLVFLLDLLFFFSLSHIILHLSLQGSMTPVYLDQPPPFPVVEFKDEQHLQLFLPSQPGAASVPSHAFFNTTHEDHRGRKVDESNHQVLDHQVDKQVSLGRSIDHRLMLSSSSSQPVVTNDTDDRRVSLASSKREDGDCEGRGDGSSVKLLPQKIRLLQKAVNSSSCSGSDNKQVKVTMKFPPYQQCQAKEMNSSSGSSSSYNHNNNNNNSSIRVCSDCNTTTTPLWRSGPRGPKSLCNACGIRQRKARRAMAAAAAAAAAVNGTPIFMETASTTKTKLHNKEKKPRTSHSAQCKKMHKTPDHPSHQSQRKFSFKNIALSLSKNSAFQGVFPQDVEEAAILLMELSCGFIHG